jgi:ketosteroid isomerase-like protein
MTSEPVQRWLDKLALAELLAVLSAAVDRGDREAIIDCYAEESYDDHGAFKGSGREFAEMICAPSGRSAQMTMHHLLGQSVFHVDHDDAWGETFFVMHAVLESGAGRGGKPMASFGRYVDYFRRIGDKWKLAYRRVVPDATLRGDDASYWKPTRDRADPRYDRLTKPPDR